MAAVNPAVKIGRETPVIKYNLPETEEVYPVSIGNNNKTVAYSGTQLVYPNLTGHSFFVTPGAFLGSIVELFVAAGMRYVREPNKADIIVFSGGEDVNPALYGEINVGSYHGPNRDKYETEVYNDALAANKPMIGICRGAQFLHVMNGGKLWQDVTGHGSSHLVLDHEDNVHFMSTSIHHQMLRPNKDMAVVAACMTRITSKFHSAVGTFTDLPLHKHYLEIEAGKYTATKCWFTQGHPEVGNEHYRSWFMSKISRFIEEVGMK